MILKIAEVIVNKQLKYATISEEDKEIYKYGYTLAIGTVVNVLLAFIIGLFLRKVLFVFSFLFLFIPLRSFCGGWHAASSLNCTIISNAIIFCVTLVQKNHWLGDNYPLLLILDIVCIFLIVLCKPQDSKSKIMSNKEKERCQKIVKIQLLLHFIITLLLFCNHYSSGVQLFLLVHIVQAILLWCGKWKNEIEKRKGL